MLDNTLGILRRTVWFPVSFVVKRNPVLEREIQMLKESDSFALYTPALGKHNRMIKNLLEILYLVFCCKLQYQR